MSAPVETKVTAASVATYLGSTALLAVLTAAQGDARLVEFMPDGLAPFVLGAIPTAIAFVGGWVAKHTPRPPESPRV